MIRFGPIAVVTLCAGLLVAAGAAVWYWQPTLSLPAAEKPSDPDYAAMVERFGGDEPGIRDELNYVVCTASSPLDPSDALKRGKLTRECLDPATLLDIGTVRTFVRRAAQGDVQPFHFLDKANRDRLMAVAGDAPTAEKVLAMRKELLALSAEFEVLRQPAEWSIRIQGEPVDLPFLDLIQEATKFRPLSQHPPLCENPRVPAFAGVDGELLAQIEEFWNTPAARRAFPPAAFPKLYVNDRMEPLPKAFPTYRAEILTAIGREKAILIPKDAKPEQVEDVDEIFDRIFRFISIVEQFGSLTGTK